MERTGPLRWLIAVLVATLVLTGCAPSAASSSGGSARRTLTIGASIEPPTMDPTANDAAAVAQALLYNVYETLVKIDNDGKIRPLLAREWSVSTDRTVYTFKLDQGAKFASGRPVRADDVVWSFDRIKNASTVTAVLKRQMAVVDRAEASDEHTVKVTLKNPSNEWLYNIAQTAGIVFDAQAQANLGTTTTGSGPYQLTEWRHGQSVILGRNTNYWGTPARFEQVTFRYFTDANAMNNAMLSGDLDIISNVQAPQALGQFSDSGRFSVLQGSTNGEVVLGMNNAHAPLDNLKVRQAIRYAINHQALLDTVWAGKGTLIGSMVPPTDPWYEDLSGDYPYDPGKARQLLAEAGVATPLKLRLRLPTTAYAIGAGQFIASQLKEVGIDCQIDQLEFARWVDLVLTKSDYDLTIVAHVEARDIVKFADSSYYWHFNNPEFQQLIKQADEGTEEEQTAKMKQAAKLLSQQAGSDFLFLLPNLVVTRSDIAGVGRNAASLSFDVTAIAGKR